MSNIDTRKYASMARKISKNLSLDVMIKFNYTNRKIRMHEAAHAVVTIACGGVVPAIFIGNKIGGEYLSNEINDGVTAQISEEYNHGMIAVAGMMQDRHPKIGLADAALLDEWVRRRVGPWPRRNSAEVRQMICHAKRKARNILIDHHAAVVAVADLLEDNPHQFYEYDIRRVACSASKKLPRKPIPRLIGACDLWKKAIDGDPGYDEAFSAIYGMANIVNIFRLEIFEQRSAINSHLFVPPNLA